MHVEITLLYAVTLGCLLLLFSWRVIALRGNPIFRFLRLGTQVNDEILQRAVRGHGNFSEYTPMFLILMLLAELNNASAWLLHLSGGLFVLGRILHGVLLCFLSIRSPLMRIGGMTGTFLGLVCLLVAILNSL